MRNFIKYGLFLIAAISLLTSNALAQSDPSGDSIKPGNNSDEPMGIGMDVNLIHYTYEELSNNSDTIIIGTVKEKLPSRWNTLDGKQPNKPLTELDHLKILFTRTLQ